MDTDNPTPGTTPAAASEPVPPHTQVTPADLRRLLDTADPQATLVLDAGQIRIETDSDAAARELPVVTRAALAERVGATPDERALTIQAAELNTEIRMLGA
ncbi:MAG: hypothetical protein HOQ36_02130 [Nocardia sp.]|nr:hypothetical protein [Nocardia sp.]